MVINAYDAQEDIQRAVNEGRHREIVGGLWDEIGRLQFDFMIGKGLTPSSRLIDVGCGCLRGGVHFVRYLKPNMYYGIDSNQSLLDSGYDVELNLFGLKDKLRRENLLCNEEFNLEAIDHEFDFAIAQSLFTHLPLNLIRLCLTQLSKKMKMGGKFYATFFHASENHPFGQPLRHGGDITTFDAKDPYHYRLSEFERLCDGLPWRVELIDAWNHPRDQRMLEFRRIEDPTAEPADATRFHGFENAAQLPAGANHYRAYVGPPDRFDFMSATQFALLFVLGLRDRHRVLDFGCGSLRLGRLLIPFLRPRHYYGIDPNKWLIADAIDRELGPSVIRIKQPNFAYHEDFRCDVFGPNERFDFIIAQSIITHCGNDLALKLVQEAGKVLERSGIFLFSIIEDPQRDASPNSDGWIYPGCVSYGAARIEEICSAAGLMTRRLPWYHPGAVWYAAAYDQDHLPWDREMPLLHGGVLFDPQFEQSRPSRNFDTRRPNTLVRFADQKGALAAGVAAGLGKVALVEPSIAEAGSFEQFRFKYTVGGKGLKPQCTLRLALRHVCQWTPPQTNRPDAPGYTTILASNGAVCSVIGWDALSNAGDVFLQMFPWQHVIDIRVDRPLEQGEEIEIIYGDRSSGSPGVRVQLFAEEDFVCRFYVDAGAEGLFLPLADDVHIPIVGGRLARFMLVAPSNARVGASTRLLIRAEDKYGNVATRYRGVQTIAYFDGVTEQRLSIDFGPSEAGICRLEGLIFRLPGDYTFRLGGTETESNPIRVLDPSATAVSTFWGELHGHTLNSDGRGTVDQYYDYAERVAGLDICAVTDHDFMISDEAWHESKRVTNAHNRPGQFVTLQAFEWSGMTDIGGDRNVYFLGDDPPIIRSRSYYDYRNQQAFHGNDVGANHVEDLFNFLTERCSPETVMVVPHYGGRPANGKWHRPEFERLIEIYSEHQRSEGWANSFIAPDHALGVIAGGDDHIGRPGYGFLVYGDSTHEVPSGHGLVAVQTKSLTREEVFAALYHRRVYATTGARILLDCSINGLPMGSNAVCFGPPVIQIDVVGTAPIAVVQIVRDGVVVYEHYPDQAFTFDEASYLSRYPDVADAVAQGHVESGYVHYCRHGMREGRYAQLLGPRAGGARSVQVKWSDAGANCSGKVFYTARVVQADAHVAVTSAIACETGDCCDTANIRR